MGGPERRVENDVATFWVEEGLLRVRVKPADSEQSGAVAEQCLGIYAELVGAEPIPAVIEIAGVKGLSREARNVDTGARAEAVFRAAAIVVAASTVARAIGNFVIAVSKPRFPTRLFENVEEALAWARAHRRTP